MDVRLIEQEGRRGIEVVVTCAPGDTRAARLVDRLQSLDDRIMAYEPGTIIRRVVPLGEIQLIEVRDERTWVLTSAGLKLESPLRLYELEETLDGTEFLRVSRHAIVNFDQVESLRPELNRRLMLRLAGGTEVLVTRKYAQEIKALLGISR